MKENAETNWWHHKESDAHKGIVCPVISTDEGIVAIYVLTNESCYYCLSEWHPFKILIKYHIKFDNCIISWISTAPVLNFA